MRSAFLIAEAGVALLFIGGYLAGWISPRRLWWLQVVAIVLPYLSVAVLAGTGAVFLLKAPRLFALHLVLCVLIALRFFPVARPAVPRGVGAPLRVMTFNAQKSFGPGSVEEEAEWAELVTTAQPHVIAVQEGKGGRDWQLRPDTPRSPAAGLDRLGYDAHQPDVAARSPLVHLVLSRLPVTEAEELRLSANGSDAEAEPLAYRVAFAWEGVPVALYSIHFRSFTEKPWRDMADRWRELRYWKRLWRNYRADFQARAAQAEAIRALLDRETVPFIVCGDFNSTPHNWDTRHLAGGLQDAFRTAGRGLGATFPSTFPLIRIDRVLTSPEWAITSAKVISTELSDHRALTAHLYLVADRPARSSRPLRSVEAE